MSASPDQAPDFFIAAETHPAVVPGIPSAFAVECLRREFTDLRQAAGLTQEEVRRRFDWSVSKIHRIEDGPSNIKVSDAIAMLALYGVTDEEQRSSVLGRVRATHASGPLERSKGFFTDDEQYYLDCEAEATTVRIFEPDLLPDILQTTAYAASVLEAQKPQQTSEHAEVMLGFRKRRAAYMLGKYGPRLHVIIDEAVLRRAVGSGHLPDNDAYQVINDSITQLQRLRGGSADAEADNASPAPASSQLNPNFTLQVVPFTFGGYRHMQYPYTLIDMPEAYGISPVLYLNRQRPAARTTEAKQLPQVYGGSFDELAARIPGPERTNEMLEWIRETNTKRAA